MKVAHWLFDKLKYNSESLIFLSREKWKIAMQKQQQQQQQTNQTKTQNFNYCFKYGFFF